jgi:hypothetical protein
MIDTGFGEGTIRRTATGVLRDRPAASVGEFLGLLGGEERTDRLGRLQERRVLHRHNGMCHDGDGLDLAS